jgi:hypothetical protein
VAAPPHATTHFHVCREGQQLRVLVTQGDVAAVPEGASGEIGIDFVTTAGEPDPGAGPSLQAAAERAMPSTSGGAAAPTKTAFYQLEHYTRLFNVDTQVPTFCSRFLRSRALEKN